MKAIRRERGATIAETGPALLILLLFTIFPAITIMGMGAQYAFAWYHNKTVIEEVANRTAADSGGTNPSAGNNTTVSPGAFQGSQVGQQIKDGFDKRFALNKFIGDLTITDTITFYARNPSQPTTTDHVEVRTTVEGKPFISLPMFGFTKVKYNIASESSREVKR